LNASLVELEARTNALEEESKVKILRFLDPMEYNQSEATWKKVTTFSWVPTNQTDNAILSVAYYAECKVVSDSPGWNVQLVYRIRVNNPHWGDREEQQVIRTYGFDWTWTPICTITFEVDNENYVKGIEPNRASYPVEFWLLRAESGGTVYVRNINIIMTVADGLPASNP
jgi:hypothetical protein